MAACALLPHATLKPAVSSSTYCSWAVLSPVTFASHHKPPLQLAWYDAHSRAWCCRCVQEPQSAMDCWHLCTSAFFQHFQKAQEFYKYQLTHKLQV